MSLTISMPSPRGFGGVETDLTRDGLCRSWLLREDFSAQSLAGTTFPPFNTRLAGMKKTSSTSNLLQNDKSKFSSEPDLTFTGGNERHNEDDEDYLFEFDVGSPTSDDEDIKDKIEESELNEEESFKVMEMMGRRFSTSSQGSTSSLGLYSSSRSPSNETNNTGFQSIFGKKCSITSSGIGSERTSIQEDEHLFVTEENNQSLLPDDWKETYTNFLITRSSSSSSEDGTTIASAATSIIASSPAEDSPLVSPDSLLDSYHIEDEQNMFYLQSHGEESSEQNTEEEVKKENGKLDKISEEDDIEVRLSSSELTSSEDEMIFTTGSTEHHIAKSKLTSLINQLETDREYSKVKENGDSGIDLSRKSSLDSTEERPPLRKTSSLKTMHTPPGTLRKKHSVRFADCLGLDLQNVKMFRDEVPRIPKCAFQDLNVDLTQFDFGSPKSPVPNPYFPPTQPRTVSRQTIVPMFTQPGATPHFNEIVKTRKVCLENTYMTEGDAVSGTIKVINLTFNKTVTVRWTADEWKSSSDQICSYVQGSSDSFTDKFSFRLALGHLPVGSRFQFCIRFSCGGRDYWDNNSGGNYVFQVFNSSGSAPSAAPIAIQSQPSRNVQCSSFGFLHMPRASSSPGSQSPSHHGDDPWLRYI